VTVPKIPQKELDTIVEQATLNVKRRLEVIEPSILAAGESLHLHVWLTKQQLFPIE
jgi:hypothetical protein